MIEIDGKTYTLTEAYVIPDDEVETVWARDFGEPNTYEVDLARKDMEVIKAFVLVEVKPEKEEV